MCIRDRARKVRIAMGTFYSLSPLLGHHPPDYALNHYKARIQPLLQYGAELICDTALHLRKPILHLVHSFLRHVFLLPHNCMIAPLYLLSGLLDLRHLWLSATWTSIQAISFLPTGHPAKLALATSMTMAAADKPSLFRSFSTLCLDIGHRVRTNEITWDSEFATGFKEAIESSQDRSLESMVSRKRCDLLHYVKWSRKLSQLLHHPNEPGRIFIIRLLSGHHSLRSATIFTTSRDSTIPANDAYRSAVMVCRYCLLEDETPLHVFARCPAHECMTLRLRHICHLAAIDPLLNLESHADLAQLLTSQSLPTLNIITRWAAALSHLLPF